MFSLITACAGNAVNDDLMQAVEDSYNDANTVINKAESYNLKVSDAKRQSIKKHSGEK